MFNKIYIFGLVIIIFIGAGCASQPLPVNQSPVKTPRAQPLTSPAKTPRPIKCGSPVLDRSSLGKAVCITGTVTKAYNIGNDYFMEFDESGNYAYGVAHNYFYFGIEGSCVRMTGVLQQDDKGRYFLQLDQPGQVDQCTLQ